MTVVTIDHVGRKGDGVALLDGGEIYVPFVLEGEEVELAGSGKRRDVEKILTPSPERIDPVCPHFGICGGCQMQHMGEETYRKWKLDLVTEPLTKAGIDVTPEALVTYPDQSRRKAVFSARHTSSGLLFGFQERAGNKVIDIKSCPVTVPAIIEQLEALRDLVSSVPGAKATLHVSVLATRNGLDVSIEDARILKGPERQALIRKAMDFDFARLAINDELLFEARKPEIRMGEMTVAPPPGGFVQAIEAAEMHMAGLVTEHLKPCKRVADLYAGIGTFALRLAHQSTVLAVEGSEPAIRSLDDAWRATAGKLKQITTEVRNLERRPLTFGELKKYDGIVFDPPRAGAELQVKQIAKSRAKRVAAVSCNPVTLARDLAILVEGGFSVSRLIPIDQFRHTPHVEVVALLER